MSKIASILACSVVASIFSCEAQALPIAPVQESDGIIQVRGFCGLGFHRGPYGYCVRNGVPYGYVGAPVVVAPPIMVAPRVVCPYGYTFYPAYGRCM
jgi:hypothetical protein